MLAALPQGAGDFAIYVTLGAMRGMVQRDFVLPEVRLTASEIVAGMGGRDGIAQAHAIRDWLSAHVEFLRDPDRGEMLHGPAWQVRRIRAHGIVAVDCDDVAMLAAALGRSIGLRARFTVVGFFSPRAPFRHIWTDLAPPNQNVWVECDITRSEQPDSFDSIRRVRHVGV
jgi:hypothetical protein